MSSRLWILIDHWLPIQIKQTASQEWWVNQGIVTAKVKWCHRSSLRSISGKRVTVRNFPAGVQLTFLHVETYYGRGIEVGNPLHDNSDSSIEGLESLIMSQPFQMLLPIYIYLKIMTIVRDMPREISHGVWTIKAGLSSRPSSFTLMSAHSQRNHSFASKGDVLAHNWKDDMIILLEVE